MVNKDGAAPEPGYGIDAPPVAHDLALAGAACLIVGKLAQFALLKTHPLLARVLYHWGM